jgi:ABC-type nitrate/sulfonate/bicarbonate transport system substrate-binding protein
MKLSHIVYRVGALAAALGVLAGPASAEPYKIRVGRGMAVEEQLWLMKAMPSLTPNQGKVYTLDYQLFRGTDQRFKSVEAGDLDIFTCSGATATIAYSQGLRFKAVASLSMESNKGFVTHYVALADSPIKKIEDLKGKIIGNNSARSSIELWARLALEKHGLNPDRDVQWAIVPFPVQGTALRSKKIDIAALPQPFYAAEKAKGGIRTIFTSKDGIPFDEELMLVLATPDLATKRPEVLRAFLADLVSANKYYIAHPKEAREALLKAKMVRVPEKLYVNMEDNYRSPSMRIDVDDLRKVQDYNIAKGYQKKRIDPAIFVDNSFLPK